MITKRRPVLKFFLTLLFLAALAAAALRAFFFLPAQAEGNEMAPAIFRGDWVAASLRAKPQRGDIVIFEHPQKRGVLQLRRVIGLPGETVALKNQIVHIDGKPLARRKLGRLTIDHDLVPGGRSVDRYEETGPGGRVWGVLLDPRRRTRDSETKVEGGYYVMGDNRNHAVDSREYGVVPMAKIRGVVRYFITARPVEGLENRGTRVK